MVAAAVLLVSLGVRADDHLGGVPLGRTGLKSDIGVHFSIAFKEMFEPICLLVIKIRNKFPNPILMTNSLLNSYELRGQK